MEAKGVANSHVSSDATNDDIDVPTGRPIMTIGGSSSEASLMNIGGGTLNTSASAGSLMAMGAGTLKTSASAGSLSVLVSRPTYTQESFDEMYSSQARPTKALKDRFHAMGAKCRCSGTCVKKTLFKYLPFIDQLRSYSVKDDLLGDAMAGLTVGVMRIPQGMAYAMLTTLPPVYGLYVSFFPVMVYYFFGMSKHLSIGTFAVVSLLVGTVLERTDCGPDPTGNSTALGNSSLLAEYNGTIPPDPASRTVEMTGEELKCKLGVATALCFMTGIIHLAMGVCRLGFVTIYMSYPLTRGLTTGASIYVFTSQVKYMFGIPVNSYSGPLNLIYIYIDFFSKITMTNISALIMSVICIVVMVIVKEFVTPKVKKYIKMPVPIELIVVIVGTLVSHFWGMEEKFNTSVVGEIPTGIPVPKLPPVNRFAEVITDAVSIALVSFAINLSLVKLFAKKHNYKIDANVELVAYGASNVVSSFFNCFNGAGSLSRSLVQEGVGGKTGIAAIVSSVLMLVVLFAIGPLFQQLPKCVLAAVIVVNLKGMFLQFKDLKELWLISIYDFLTWLVVFLAVFFLNVDMGLGVGIAFSLLSVVFRTQRPYTSILGHVEGTDLYKNLVVYPDAKEIPGMKIFRFESSLYYANVEHFVQKMYAKIGINPQKLLAERTKKEKAEKVKKAKIAKQEKKDNTDNLKQDDNKKKGSILKRRKVQPSPEREVVKVDMPPPEKGAIDRQGARITNIIIDCTTMAYIDYMGVSTLGEVIDDYDKVGVNVCLAGCKAAVREMLEAAGFYENISKEKLYVSVHDGVLAARVDGVSLTASTGGSLLRLISSSENFLQEKPSGSILKISASLDDIKKKRDGSTVRISESMDDIVKEKPCGPILKISESSDDLFEGNQTKGTNNESDLFTKF